MASRPTIDQIGLGHLRPLLRAIDLGLLDEFLAHLAPLTFSNSPVVSGRTWSADQLVFHAVLARYRDEFWALEDAGSSMREARSIHRDDKVDGVAFQDKGRIGD